MGPMLDLPTPTDSPRRGPFRRPATVVAAIAASAVVAIGALISVDLATRDHEEHTATFDEPIAFVDAELSAGAVHIVGTDDPQVTVTRRARSGVLGPHQHEAVDGDRLVIRADCPSGLFAPSCRVDYEVRVPAGVAVRLRTNGGTAEVDGIFGDVDAHANGGRVALTYTTPRAHLKARTNGGQVVVEVPDGPESYDVDADANGGPADVQIRTDPRSDRLIDAHANGGKVIVRYAA
jgi:hypothetical protein